MARGKGGAGVIQERRYTGNVEGVAVELTLGREGIWRHSGWIWRRLSAPGRDRLVVVGWSDRGKEG